MPDKNISWNPWKNKKKIAQFYQEQQDLISQQQQQEADRREKEEQLQNQLRWQRERHQAEIVQREMELARERQNLAQEREVRAQQEYEAEQRRAQQEYEAKQRKQQKQDRLAREAREAQEAQRIERERRLREQRKRNERLKRLKMNTPDSLRSLRELIRTRYELDMEIWRLRDVRAPDRPIVEEKMEKSDAVLAEIVAIVSSWEGTEESWNMNEWEMAQDVRNRLLIAGKRRWEDSPPWGED